MRFLTVQLVPGLLLLGSTLALATSSGTAQARTAMESIDDHCARLAKFDLRNATITSATAVAAGTFDGPRQAFTGADMSALYKMLPAFCRIVVKATPSSDSDIGVEVWMPLDGWNGKLAGLGNGGFAGIIDDVGLAAAVAKRYAAVATDAGHTGSPADASWALGHPEKVIDFGHRGIHEMTRVAKLVVQQFYGSLRHAGLDRDSRQLHPTG
jgi:feruloyl esterase